MKHLRYFSEFYDREGVRYRIEILQEAEAAYTPKEVVLASDPVVIEWSEVTKIDPLVCSGATLRLVSMSDRQFVDLYSVEPCAIRLDVYRAGALYWSGTLDTELFEEPYSQLDRYITEITFSDFGVLDRLQWEQKGVVSIASILDTCIAACEIQHTGIVKSISTTIPGVEGDLFENCSLTLDNFFDEDGESWAMKEVLEEVLRPFALQLKQKNGKVHIYDLNSLATTTPQSVKWRESNSQLGVEPTYNRVVVTYSPYSQSTILDAEWDVKEILPASEVEYSFKVPIPDTDYNGFTLLVGPAISEPTEVQCLTIGTNARLFRTEAENNGSDDAGVLWGWRNQIDTWIGNAPIDNGTLFPDTTPLITTPRMPIQGGAGYFNIKISLDVLFDVRLNPFDSGSFNYDEEWEEFKTRVNFFAIPCSLFLYTSDGKTYTYDNSGWWNNIAGDGGNFQQMYFANQGKWIEATDGVALLTYYSESDREEDTGLGGWATNKQSIGRWTGDIPKNITLNIDGEKIPTSNKTGELQLVIYRGAKFVDSNLNQVNQFSYASEVLRWQLYKNLQISIVEKSGRDIDVEDVEHSAWLNKAAREELSIDTFVGTPSSRVPMARGAILKSSTSEMIDSFTRAGVTDKLERLLIGTIYSNYALRRNVLSGTIKLIPQNVILSDKSSVNNRYVALSLTESLESATAEIKMAEFDKDTYEGIEYE